jgi:hypothetical protein
LADRSGRCVRARLRRRFRRRMFRLPESCSRETKYAGHPERSKDPRKRLITMLDKLPEGSPLIRDPPRRLRRSRWRPCYFFTASAFGALCCA